jgi:hypothetical protein
MHWLVVALLRVTPCHERCIAVERRRIEAGGHVIASAVAVTQSKVLTALRK